RVVLVRPWARWCGQARARASWRLRIDHLVTILRVTSDPAVDEVREKALDRLRSNGRVVIVGPGGVGKTTLVARGLDELAPDEVITVAAELIDSTARIASTVLDAIGEPRLAGDSDAALIESALAGRRIAIVVDGAESIVDDVLSWSAQVPADGEGPWV